LKDFKLGVAGMNLQRPFFDWFPNNLELYNEEAIAFTYLI
jgi:hypothetical protein